MLQISNITPSIGNDLRNWPLIQVTFKMMLDSIDVALQFLQESRTMPWKRCDEYLGSASRYRRKYTSDKEYRGLSWKDEAIARKKYKRGESNEKKCVLTLIGKRMCWNFYPEEDATTEEDVNPKSDVERNCFFPVHDEGLSVWNWTRLSPSFLRWSCRFLFFFCFFVFFLFFTPHFFIFLFCYFLVWWFSGRWIYFDLTYTWLKAALTAVITMTSLTAYVSKYMSRLLKEFIIQVNTITRPENRLNRCIFQ